MTLEPQDHNVLLCELSRAKFSIFSSI